MRKSKRDDILRLFKKAVAIKIHEIVTSLGISRQAVHKHLRCLEAEGLLCKLGQGPHVTYALAEFADPLGEVCSDLKNLFSTHPDVCLVTLFGSYSRGTAKESSDVDVLVWLSAKSSLKRQELFQFYDEKMRQSEWKEKVSLIPIRLREELPINTLLLDLPEEHRVVFDRKKYFAKISRGILDWRKKNGAKKIASFGGKHAWLYSDKSLNLDQISFTVRIRDVA